MVSNDAVSTEFRSFRSTHCVNYSKVNLFGMFLPNLCVIFLLKITHMFTHTFITLCH